MDEIEVAGKTVELIVGIACKLCIGKFADGKPVRPFVDKLALTRSVKQIVLQLQKSQFVVTEGELMSHLKNHCEYLEAVKEAVDKAIDETPVSNIDEVAKNYVDPDEVLQAVVNIGNTRLLSGDIKVTGDLLLKAIKEQTSRKTTGTLKDLLDGLDRGRFIPGPKLVEGQVFEEVEKKSE